MQNQCSTLNPDCIAQTGVQCPAFENNMNCWEFDWLPLIKKMPQEDQSKWKLYMRKKCPACPAFQPAMHAMIQRIEKELQH